MYWTYALYSKSADLLYVGQTKDLEKRIQQHNGLTKFKNWTHRHKPWELLHTETFPSRKEAILRESQLKSGQGRVFLRSLIPPLDPPQPKI
jgi:putative endonuclease